MYTFKNKIIAFQIFTRDRRNIQGTLHYKLLYIHLVMLESYINIYTHMPFTYEYLTRTRTTF